MRADQIHLQQVMLNLAANGMDAVQSCAPGVGKMSIQTALIERSAIEVSVTDSGTGIPTDKLNEIFDTFYTTKLQGTGLGLCIARTISRRMGVRYQRKTGPKGAPCFGLPCRCLRGWSHDRDVTDHPHCR